MTGRFEQFDARPGGSYRLVLAYADASAAREVRRRLRRGRAMGGHPVDTRSRVDIRADDVPDGINAADHAALSAALRNLLADDTDDSPAG